MEPPAALAEYRDGKVETWTATQDPQQVQETVSKALGIKPEDVTCHVTLLGGAFGRKSKPDYVAEAAILSKKVGKPVKISWAREEDIRFDYYHSTSGMYFKAGLDANGKPAAFLMRTVFPPIGSTFDEKERYGGAGELSMGVVDLPFDIPNIRAENGPAEAHLRIGQLLPGHAVLLQPVLEEAPGLLAEAATEGHRLLHDHRAGTAERGQRGGHLARDVGPADQDHPLAGGVVPDRLAVAERAQVMDARQLAPGDAEPPDVRPRRQQRLVERHYLAIGQLEAALGERQLGHGDARQCFNPLLLVPLRRSKEHILTCRLALEVAL